MMVIVLQTERLILRRFTLADSNLLLELNSDPDVTKYVHELPLKNEADAKVILRDNILPQYALNLGRWAVHLKTNNAYIGWCGLKYIEANKEIDLGYRFLKNCWGKGYATESAKGTLAFAHLNLGLPLVWGKAHIENLASINVLLKIGMQYMADAEEDGCPIKIYSSEISDYINKIVKEK